MRSAALSILTLSLLCFGCDQSHTVDDAGARADARPPGVDAGPIHWAACGAPSECVILANSCCGVCGVPELGDVDGVNRDYAEGHYLNVCPESAEGPVPCPRCPSAPNADLVATCAGGSCAVFDVGTDDLSACTDSSECVVRVPDCCPCGADTGAYRLIALRADRVSEYEGRVCDPGTGCAECEPVYPDDVAAICNAEGHCQIELLAP